MWEESPAEGVQGTGSSFDGCRSPLLPADEKQIFSEKHSKWAFSFTRLACVKQIAYNCFMETNKSDSEALASVLMHVVQRMEQTQARGLRRLGYDPIQVAILEQIVLRGPVHPSTIAEELDIPPSSVTRQVQVLEQANHVVVTRDAADRRACLLEATAAGREELQRLQAISVEAFARLLDSWQPEEIRLLTTLLTRFAASLPASPRNQRIRRSWWRSQDEE